jgi:hypothetical protein
MQPIDKESCSIPTMWRCTKCKKVDVLPGQLFCTSCQIKIYKEAWAAKIIIHCEKKLKTIKNK